VLGKLSAPRPEVVKNQVLARVRFTGTQPAACVKANAYRRAC